MKTFKRLLGSVLLISVLVSTGCASNGNGGDPIHTHTEAVIPEERATCVSQGLSEGRKCTSCGIITVMPQIVENGDHVYDGNKCVYCGYLKPSEGLMYTASQFEAPSWMTKSCFVSGTSEVIDEHIVIPSEYEGMKVVEILGGRTFTQCAPFTMITIPNSIDCINESAFADCTSLEEVTIPDSVSVIWREAFAGCTSLEAVAIPSSIMAFGEGVFRGCTSLKSVSFYQGATGSGSLTTIEGYMFEGCTSLTEITLCEGVKYICENAFAECTQLTDVAIPKGIENIEELAFLGCESLERIHFGGTVQEWIDLSVGYMVIISHEKAMNVKIICSDGEMEFSNNYIYRNGEILGIPDETYPFEW